jgi:hypothetical protein
MGALVAVGELTKFLHHSVNADAELTAIRMAEAWLSSVCAGMPPWPAPVPEDLWAWALELTSIAYSNPTSMMARTTDEDTRTWSLSRRKEILDAAAKRYGDGSGTTDGAGPLGVGNFPIALSWPDPPVVGW